LIKENRDHYWDLAIELEERKNEIEPKLPKVTGEEFEEYCLVVDILGPLYKYLGG